MKKTKIFFITTELPSRKGGANVRNFNMLKFLDKKYFDISLFTIVNNEDKILFKSVKKELNIPIYKVNYKNLNPFLKLFYLFSERTIPFMKEYEKSTLSQLLLKQIKIKRPDIIHLEQLHSYYAIRKIIPTLKKMNIKIVLDEHNIEYIAFKEGTRSMQIVKRLLGKYVQGNLWAEEMKAIKDSHYTFVCSDEEKKYILSQLKNKRIDVIPNGVDCDYFTTDKSNCTNTLLFMGGTSYPPNNEGLKYYFSDIHLLVKKQIPNLKIYILGSNPPSWLKKIASNDSSVYLTGAVKDVRKYLIKASVCICPIKSGSGTRLKVLEYLASGKAVVSTTKGAEGIRVKNKLNIFLADSALDFTEKIILLLKNPVINKNLVVNGRKLIENNYQWKKNIKKVENVYINLVI
jgi:polysaccharide biosynthesis protein PslH